MPRIDTVPFEWQPDVWLVMAAIAARYVWAIRNPASSARGEPSTGRHRWLFFGGLATLTLSATWPLDTMGDRYLFSAHKVQFLLMTLVAAPLLLAGIPGWLLREVTRPVRTLLARLSRPLGALLAFNAVLVLSHWPVIVGLYTRVQIVHFGMHVVWVATGLLFWLPVLSPIPEYQRLNEPLQMGYLFLSSVLPTVPASFLTFAERPFYDAYAEAPRLWGITPVHDIQIAGLIMKLGGGIVLWSVITVIFFRWVAAQPDPSRLVSSVRQ